MRYLISERFEKFVANRQFNEVAVVGGTEYEPELSKLTKSSKFKVTFYGIEPSPKETLYLDLNLTNEINKTFDLVLCSQVLEHIYDLNSALNNLISMCTEDTILWLNFPTSNRVHGSPDYYCAGYTSQAIYKLLKSKIDFEIIVMEDIGTVRNYFLTHALRIWPSKKELSNPVIHYDFNRYSFSLIRNLLTYIKQFPLRSYSLILNNEISNNLDYSTESILAITKIRVKNS